ncbi:MAG: AraC family transcriptional regulator [Clostridia bacterium]|nr:AraC family transcriptional regulator [Clostridia bacterium]
MKYAEYKEQKKHGSESFPIQYYFVDENHPQYVMPLHWHREFEVIRVKQGTLTLYLNNIECRMGAGEVRFVAPGTLHRGEPSDCVYECAVFDMRMISGYNSVAVSELLRPIESGDMEVDVSCPAAEGAACALLDAVRAEESYFELKVLALIAEIFYSMYDCGAVRPLHSEGRRFAHRRAVMTLLIDKIEKEYTKRITLSDLAEMTQINEKYLCRFFKEFTGQTPIDYINRLRIDRACYEMTVNKMNVTEAAYECGFNELSYFSKTFKKYKGMSPGQYKQRFALQ